MTLQLSAQCLHAAEILQSTYSQSQNGQIQPAIEDLRLLLLQMLKIFDGTYILLNALDKCADQEDLLEFIKALMSWNIHDLHVLATSRENDIATSFELLISSQLCIQIALADANICGHILERLSNNVKLKKWPANVHKEIEHALMRGALGM